MTQVVIKVIGNYSYQTSKCLGEGVYGKVYEGMERESKEKVAIKKIDLSTFTNDKYLQNAIFSQIYLLKRFNHPNIVKFKDVLSSKNSLYIITQYCKNGDLKQLMKRRKFKEDEVFEIMRQILNGFTELIKEKIVHRDLKPANILIHDGVYKIGDFGFAKYVDNFGSQMLKSCVGSPIYMAPQILQRVQYTTKCDIWSLGVIFYEMLYGYPPWKARDENELLKGIKTISISHILKRNSLTPKSIEFMKRTLAYSEEERIAWTDLFDLFIKPVEKPQVVEPLSADNIRNPNKDRGARLISNGSSWSQQQLTPPNNLQVPNPPQNTGSNVNISPSINAVSIPSNNGPSTPTPSGFGGRQTINSSSGAMVRPQGVGLGGAVGVGERKVFGGGQSQQMDNVLAMRQFCIFYHYYLVELFVQFGYVKMNLGQVEVLLRLYYSLSLLIKYKSTYCISIMSIHYKNNKALEQIYKRTKLEHETYEMIYAEVITKLDREGCLKKVKAEMAETIGYGDIINEEKTDKIETIMIKNAHEFTQVVSDEVRRRVKSIKDFTIVEILENTVDVLSLGIGKSRSLKELREDVKAEDEDLRDYVSKVINKLDRITSSL